MATLVEYLDSYHLESELEDIQRDFIEKFGVNVKQESDLYLFKYNLLSAKWTKNITWECRGHIIRWTDAGWKYVCRPFDKFFNQHEGWSPLFDAKYFESVANQLCFFQKADGTCITLWYDEVRDEWRASTLGMITAGNVYDFDLTFDQLFWKTLGLTEEEVRKYLDKSMTYIFELCAPENRILTKYDSPKVFMLSIRNTKYGTYCDPEVVEDFIITVNEAGGNITEPIRYFFYELGIKTVEDAKLYVQEATAETEKYGEYPEGFVIYQSLKPIAKMKNAQYVSLHHVSGGDILHTRNVIIDAFFCGTLDDIYDHLVDSMKEFAESLKDKVAKLFLNVRKSVKSITSQNYETQKDYALAVQKIVDKKFWVFFFQNKDQILAKDGNPFDIFTKWISTNYGKYVDYWKGNE